jgi:hypothetical protein
MTDRKQGLSYELYGVGKDSFPHTLKGRGKVTGLRGCLKSRSLYHV